MRFFNVFLLIAVIIAAVSASPVLTEEDDFEIEPRFTCDLLGNEQLCVLHCYAQGKSGGWCDDHKVCNCR